MKIKLRNLELSDLKQYEKLKHPSQKFHEYNGPYYRKQTELELKKEIQFYKNILEKNTHSDINVLKNKKIIADTVTNEIVGEVNWYWKSEETYWMEIGVVIFNEKYWGKSLGFQALQLLITEKFKENSHLVRLGISTWSGNVRMMRLAEKLGMQKEAVYRKARIVNGEYFDSVSYGILKEEWIKKGEK